MLFGGTFPGKLFAGFEVCRAPRETAGERSGLDGQPGRRADGKGRHWQRATGPDRYPVMSDDELVDIVFPTSGRARVSNLVGEARQVLKNLERAGELRIIQDKALPPLNPPPRLAG